MSNRKSASSRPRGHAGDQGADEPGKAEATRQSILDAAARIFRRDGYSATRLADIAEAVGMKAGSLYYHFESREALVEAVMEIGTRRTQEAIADALQILAPDAGCLRRLEVAIETHLVMVLAQEDIASATIKLIWQVPLPIREKLLVRQRAYGRLWNGLLTDARKAGAIRPDLDLSVVRMAIMGALNWAADWYKPGRMTPQQIARDVVQMVLGGLASGRLPAARPVKPPAKSARR